MLNKAYLGPAVGMFAVLTFTVTVPSRGIRILLLAPVFILYIISLALFGYEYDRASKKRRKK